MCLATGKRPFPINCKALNAPFAHVLCPHVSIKLAFLSQASSALIQAKKLEYKAMLRQRDNNKTSKAD
jgi:hypothetical protein